MAKDRNKSLVGWNPPIGNGVHEVVGAGNWVVTLHKGWQAPDEWRYWFRILRAEQTAPATYSDVFHPADLLELPKLAQVLAATIVQDGCIEPSLRDDLACLAAGLDWYLGLKRPGQGSPWVILKRDAVQAVLDHLWDDEFADFRALPAAQREGHIFQEIALLSGMMNGASRTGEDYLQLYSRKETAC
jgi:hypothetical protein